MVCGHLIEWKAIGRAARREDADAPEPLPDDILAAAFAEADHFRAELDASLLVDPGENFRVTVQAWGQAARRTGRAADSTKGYCRTDTCWDWANHFQMNKQFAVYWSTMPSDLCKLLCEFWVRKMRYFWEASGGDKNFRFTDELCAAYVPPPGFQTA